MAKAKPKSKKTPQELDSVYVLKLVLYMIVGTQWIHVISTTGGDLPLPIGLVIGILFASHDHFQIDRKVEYAVLVIATLVGYWAQIGFFIH